ncbi:hypothetical protein AAFF_G00136070 [Aldrovandia affinis]|uniref:Reverse transcriptase domain-containing protein n=1 Tax=Aldrovandia affinis TaxID=143900 RepID=A0AAD7RSJ5_9TELE|nr:hypothetical protein AAFF_G00136070 [Aldrovandia affinis]
MTTKFNIAVTETATAILGKLRPKKNPWVTNELLDLCDKRRALKRSKNSPEGYDAYRTINKDIKKQMQSAKQNWIEEHCKEIENSLKYNNNTKMAYQTVKKLTKTKQPRASTIQSKTGECLTEEQKILDRWTEYCSELYNRIPNGDPAVLSCPQTTEDDEKLPILREEVEAAVRSLKKGKAAGVDNIPAELLQAGGEAIIDVLTIICNKIWQSDHEGSVSIGGRTITNLRFADDIDGLARGEKELASLVERLDVTSRAYGMEISTEKTKLMTNNNNIMSDIRVNGQALDCVSSFKYLGAIISDEGSKKEVLARIAQTTAALTQLKPIWKDKNISLGSKVRLLRSLVISIFLYACESWTLTAEIQQRIQSLEMRCYRRLLGISYTQHITNMETGKGSAKPSGRHDDLLTIVEKRKLRWYGHITRSSGLAKTILQGTVQGGRKRGRPKKRWEDNIQEWTQLRLSETVRAAEDRERWRELVDRSSVVPQRPSGVMG